MEIKNSAKELAFFFLFLLIAALFLYIWPKWTVDDAFITFRYAKNWVNHGEINWNPGEDPVEGYTNFSWLILVAAALRAGIDPVRFTSFAGAFLLVSILILFYQISKIFRLEVPTFMLLFILFIFNFQIYTHVFSGLETIFFVFLTLFIFYVSSLISLKNENSSKKRILLYAILSTACLLISITRPEGLIFSAVALAYLFFKGLPAKERKIFLLFVSFLFLMPYSSYFLWRLQYYGYLFPNTFYAKTNIPTDLLNQFKSIVAFVLRIFAVPAVLIGFILTKTGLRSWLKDESIKKEIGFYIAFLVANVPVFAVYMKSWLDMNYSYRYYYHLGVLDLLIMILIADKGLKILLKDDTNFLKSNLLFYGFPALMIAGIIINLPGAPHEYRFCRDYKLLLEQQHIAIGKKLKELLPSNSVVACIFDAGAIPYYSDLVAVDFGMLNDEYLAHHANETRSKVSYFFERDPDAVVITSSKRNEISYPFATEFVKAFLSELIQDRRFKERYELFKVYETNNYSSDSPIHVQYHHVFLKKSSLNSARKLKKCCCNWFLPERGVKENRFPAILNLF